MGYNISVVISFVVDPHLVRGYSVLKGLNFESLSSVAKSCDQIVTVQHVIQITGDGEGAGLHGKK